MPSRVKAIVSLIPEKIKIVYDLCCDLGLIGKTIDKLRAIDKIIYIDSNEKIKGLQNFICADAREFVFSNEPDVCYVIAGIGGKLAIEIFDNILNCNQDVNKVFIFCVNRDHEELKEKLSAIANVKQQIFYIKEGSYSYEVIQVSLPRHVEEIVINDLAAELDFYQKKIRHLSYKKDNFSNTWLNKYKHRQEKLIIHNN